MNRSIALIAILFFISTAGCGNSSSAVLPTKPCVPTKGQLTIGGKPAEGATIILVPAGASDARPQATVDANGNFTLSTFGKEDGAPVGEYGLIVFWPGPESDDRLNGRFSTPEKSKQKVTIAEGKPELPPIQLK